MKVTEGMKGHQENKKGYQGTEIKTIREALESYRHDDGKGYENIYFPEKAEFEGWTLINRTSHSAEFESKRKPSIRVKKRLNEVDGKWDVWAINGGMEVASQRFAGSKEEEAVDFARSLMDALE